MPTDDNSQDGENIGGPGRSDLDLFLEKLKSLPNGKSGNKSLRDALGWGSSEDRYWAARGRAIDHGYVVSGRGKGGSVILAQQLEIDEGVNAQPEIDTFVQSNMQVREIDLYPPALEVISQTWANYENYDDYSAAITAMRGRAPTGGKWTRPDIAVLGIKTFPYFPGRIFDIVTFEIKPLGQTNVEGIFEALSHQQFATRSYCIYHFDLAENETFQEKCSDADRILSTARMHGVGVFVASDIGDWDTWEKIIEAERVRPDPEQANRFIVKSFDQRVLEKVIKWQK